MNKALLVLILFPTITMAKIKKADVSDSDVKTVEAHVPKILTDLTDLNGKPLTLDNGIGYNFIKADLDGNKSSYFVVLYQGSQDNFSYQCILSAINGNTQKTVVALPKLESELGNCDEIQAVDVDGDGKPEIIITSRDPNSGSKESDFRIFKWDGKQFADLTPLVTVDGEQTTAFRNAELINMGNSTLIVEKPWVMTLHGEPQGSTVGQSYKVYSVKNGKIEQQEALDFFEIFTKKADRPATPKLLSYEVPSAGTYIFEMKNISTHKYAVRAEVLVNGSVVMKPADFCEGSPKNKTKGSKGDEDDSNEDHLKGCKGKVSNYAIVNLKTKNTISVKIFGTKDSRMQLTIKKK